MSPKKKSPASTAVIGMGNILLQDDGIGMEVVHQMEEQFYDMDVDYVEAGIYLDIMLDCLNKYAHVILITAIKFGNDPGTIYLLDGQKLLPFRRMQYSLYEKNLWELLKYAKKNADHLSIDIIGIEPSGKDFGIGLSPYVTNSISNVIQSVIELIPQNQN